MSEIPEILREVENTNDLTVLDDKYQDILPKLKKYWDVHPHSSMEYLQNAAEKFPLEIARKLIREVVLDWKKRPNYSWQAGGNADHCFLSALFLTGNYDLAEKDLILKNGNSILRKAEDYGIRVKDAEEKIKLLKDGLIYSKK